MATSTYTPISTQTVSGSSTSTITFSSIPSTYTDLVLVCVGQQSGTVNNLRVRFNSDTGTNYSETQIQGDGSTAASSRLTNQTGLLFPDWTTGVVSNILTFNINNYSNTTTYKTSLMKFPNTTRGYVVQYVGLWRSTSAISTITVDVNTEYFIAGSTFTLYGIKAA